MSPLTTPQGELVLQWIPQPRARSVHLETGLSKVVPDYEAVLTRMKFMRLPGKKGKALNPQVDQPNVPPGSRYDTAVSDIA